MALSASALASKKDVMPLFKDKCDDCHSTDTKKVKGGLRLDDEEHFYKLTNATRRMTSLFQVIGMRATSSSPLCGLSTRKAQCLQETKGSD